MERPLNRARAFERYFEQLPRLARNSEMMMERVVDTWDGEIEEVRFFPSSRTTFVVKFPQDGSKLLFTKGLAMGKPINFLLVMEG